MTKGTKAEQVKQKQEAASVKTGYLKIYSLKRKKKIESRGKLMRNKGQHKNKYLSNCDLRGN